jgi:hypothetical protein
MWKLWRLKQQHLSTRCGQPKYSNHPKKMTVYNSVSVHLVRFYRRIGHCHARYVDQPGRVRYYFVRNWPVAGVWNTRSLCVDALLWNVSMTSPSNFRNDNIHRYTAKDYDKLTSKLGGLSEQLDLVGNMSIYKARNERENCPKSWTPVERPSA